VSGNTGGPPASAGAGGACTTLTCDVFQIFANGHVAITSQWLFVSDAAYPGGLFRLPKP
jgi:hypothetical protein